MISTFVIATSALILIAGIYMFVKQELFKNKIDKYKPYDILELKDGQLVSLLMWSANHCIYQCSDKSMKQGKWSIVKNNYTYNKREISNDCENNFKRLGIPFPIIIKKDNKPEDAVHTKHTEGVPETLNMSDFLNIDFDKGLDKFSTDELDDLRILLEAKGRYEDLAKLRDYMIIREKRRIE